MVKQDKKVDTQMSMDELAEEQDEMLIPFATGDMVKCKVINNSANRVLCDINGLTYGFVPEKEFSFDTKELKEGDEVTANVMSMENKDGYVVLSLRRADRDKVWGMLQEKMDSATLVEVKVVGANRGGLMVEAGGLQGFLPVSQLSQAHYPRVEGGDPNQILAKLRRIVGEILSVKIIAVDKTEEKLIFSEKSASGPTAGGEIEFEVGQDVEGFVSGIAPFGLFVNLKSIEGLVHISEVSWEHVDDLTKLYKIGDKINARVVKIDDGKVSLSIKRLQADPWIEQMKKLRVGQKIEGEVGKMTAYGAFVRLENGLDGLVHLSQSSGDIEKIKALQTGEKHRFEVIELKPEARRIGLRLID
jgi:small subunit ribosomal protein S1